MGWSVSQYDLVNVCPGVVEEGNMVGKGAVTRYSVCGHEPAGLGYVLARVRSWLYHTEGSRLMRFPKEVVKADCMIAARCAY